MSSNLLLKQSIEAVEKEIEAVLKRPAHAVLYNPKTEKAHADDDYRYSFDWVIQSLNFVDEIRALQADGTSIKGRPVAIEDEKMILAFNQPIDDESRTLHIEWENDFVLRRLKEKLEVLEFNTKKNTDTQGLMDDLIGFNNNKEGSKEEFEVYDDQFRNPSQHGSIEKALRERVTFIWGPPGTGKTTTLGYVIANYLLYDKRVLFLSNTNRAVDVGVLSVIDALKSLDSTKLIDNLVRFGDVVLESDLLDRVSFVFFKEQILEKKREKVFKLVSLVDRLKHLEKKAEKLLSDGKDIPNKLEQELILTQNEVEAVGGMDYIEDYIERANSVNERYLLQSKAFVGTTLAKICTSELFDGLSYDAVVIDEASMANLPFVLVASSLAKEHLVLAGDPMQLPPISLSNDKKASEFLEKDVFTFISNSKFAEDLFSWHEFNQDRTTFFDTQYRLNPDLAENISKLFYEGKLKTATIKEDQFDTKGPSIFILDSAQYDPFLEQSESGSGFRPVNKKHEKILEKSVEKLLEDISLSLTDIGIIVPFRSNVYEYQNLIKERRWQGIEVGTIHTFQGREKKVMIFDTVMTGEKTRNGKIRHFSVRPFDEDKSGLKVARLLNVACSRSKEKLIIIADRNHINQIYGDKLLGKMINLFSA